MRPPPTNSSETVGAERFEKLGYAIFEEIFSPQEVTTLIRAIDEVSCSPAAFRKNADIFAIRQFIKEVPQIQRVVFNPNLRMVIRNHIGPDCFVVKSIYFDKPPASNWFVAWHQDLTISVDKKVELPGFPTGPSDRVSFRSSPRFLSWKI